MKAKFLQAKNGDAILLSFFDPQDIERHILIDGGTASTYQAKSKKESYESGALKKALDGVPQIDLLVLTHIDDDHIAGLLNWFECDDNALTKVKKVWFNGGCLLSDYFKQPQVTKEDPLIQKIFDKDTSVRQGLKFVQLIEEAGIWDRQVIKSVETHPLFGLEIIIISPNEEKLKRLLGKWEKERKSLNTTAKNDYSVSIKEHITLDKFKEDKSIPNGSSISFIIKNKDKNYLFLSDSHPSVIIESLNNLGITPDKPLKTEFVKVSHHGSKFNTNNELLELIDTKRFVFSSNGDGHNLPHKNCVSRIINKVPDAELIFNYKKIPQSMFSKEDLIEYPNLNISVFENEDIL
ncbi:MBL fold metallo-hydrolase [Vibrio sp. Isolate33]|uniref:ComEC/Rec2 family competence protein n=1 Tax=Vibrio sp. Isolate33 TaxID=2908539 RepID=UPI001EFEBBE1|nr:MBL fold metallo-hydrolase [Vibrio sp. Isolate33]MCG9542310.1 MBL fold metallo-hydrolase [Vibrio sp. Isolate33]